MWSYKLRQKRITLLKVIEIYGFLGVARILFRLNRGPLNKVSFKDAITAKELFEDISPVINFVSPEEFQIVYNEFARVKKELFAVPTDRHYFTSEYDLGDNLLFALYLIISNKNEVHILESGVAAGKSTSFILSLQNEFGSGTLQSIDITSKVGDLIPNYLKNDFNLHVLPQVNRRMKFREIVKELGMIDVFIHDSDHSVEYQLYEIETILKFNPTIKWLLIDDINVETVDFLRKYDKLKSLLIIDEGHKFSAVARNFEPY